MHIETSKPHIAQLPIVPYKSTPITDDKLAVSIPLFHSATDSGTMTDFNAERLKQIHTKGAIWTAIALQNNTDLTQHGAAIFFHVEDTIADIVADMMAEFDVPQSAFRQMTLPQPRNTKIQHPHYGKKLMCLDDPDFTPDSWLIVDSDAFVCSSKKRLAWYEKLISLDNPATVQAALKSATPYQTQVYGMFLAAGLTIDPELELYAQEHRAFRELGFHYFSHPKNQYQQYPYIATQLTYIPTSHDIHEFLKKHYINCYQDEFLMGMWHLINNNITQLTDTLDGLPLFYTTHDYINRDKSLDADGYLLHLKNSSPEQVEIYYPDFFDALQPESPSTKPVSGGLLTAPESTDNNNNEMVRSSISEKLKQTTSDKEAENGHRYGKIYDLIFDAVYQRQRRNLRICEIGVSFFGEGSLKAFQELPIVAEVVGIDVLDYTGHIAPHTTFHKVDNAYTHKTIHSLKQHHEPFDIIIDDGSHDPEHQQFFVKYYYDLLADGGCLICEDVYDPDFFKRMCDESDCFGFDGWANLGAGYQMTDQHDERILMREKASPVGARLPRPLNNERILMREKASPVGARLPRPLNNERILMREKGYQPTAESRFRFHLLGIAYGPTHKDFSACAFVQKTRKGSNMLHKLEHQVYHYGHERSEIDCTEHIPVIDDFVLQKTYGTSDHNGAPSGYNVEDLTFTTFDINTERELRKRIEPGDFVLTSFPHKNIAEHLADLPVHVVEWGIGYPQTYADYRVYESNGWMHFHRGMEHANGTRSYNDPDWCSAVIPNYFDPDEFEFCDQKDDYMLFIGRVDRCKGIEIALEMAKRTGVPLYIAGQNFLGDELYQMMPRHAEYLGVVDSDERKGLLSKAKAVVCPSMYLEPFLGVHIEAGFCGTPVITTNWGAPVEYCKHGVTGFRCQTGAQFVHALEHIDEILPEKCRIWAYNNFSMEKVSNTYHEYFEVIYRNINGFFW